jgi:hypothetical protein
MRDSDYPLLGDHYWKSDRRQGQFNRSARDGHIILLKLIEEFSLDEFTRDDVMDALGAYVPTGYRDGSGNSGSRKLNLMAGLDSLVADGYVQEDEGSFAITDLGREFADELEGPESDAY